MKLVIGCDEAAYRLKEEMKEYIRQLGHEVKDIGVYHEEPSLYPDTAFKAAAGPASLSDSQFPPLSE